MDSIVGEVWRPVAGFEGYYEVSDHGRVRSLDRTITTSHGRKRFYRGQIRAYGVLPSGYYQVPLIRHNIQHMRYVHRLVLESFVCPCPSGTEACHSDGNRSNNRLSNLRWDTHTENEQDKVLHKTIVRGEKGYNARLTEAIVIEMRAAYASGVKQMEIARQYDLDIKLVHKIIRRQRWKHIP